MFPCMAELDSSHWIHFRIQPKKEKCISFIFLWKAHLGQVRGFNVTFNFFAPEAEYFHSSGLTSPASCKVTHTTSVFPGLYAEFCGRLAAAAVVAG